MSAGDAGGGRPFGIDKIEGAADLETLKAALAAAMDASYDEFRINLRLAWTPDAEKAAREEWRGVRLMLHAAFGRRLREIEGRR